MLTRVAQVWLVSDAREPRWRSWLQRPGVSLAVLAVSGCSATSSVEHEPAQIVPVDDGATVDMPLDVVWDHLDERLAAAGFDVVEVDEDNRIMRVALSGRQPEDYVDCGQSERTFESALGSQETFSYDPASSATYKLTSFQGTPLEATRDTALEAVAEVRLREQGTATEVSVDVAYTVNAMVSYMELGPFGTKGTPTTTGREIVLRTNQPSLGDEEMVMCVSKGQVERRLLDAVGANGQ